MAETPEGIGSRKFSLLRHAQEDGTEVITLQQGATPLAAFTPEGEKVKLLLVTAPQLWDAANDLLQALKILRINGDAAHRLADMVAKAVGKDSYSQVDQA